MATFNISVTIPDAQVARLQAALTALGQTPKALLINQLIQVVRQYEAAQALGAVQTLEVT